MTLPPLNKQELLSTHFLFRDMDAAVIERIAKLGVTRKLDANEVLFLKGDPGDALYGVLSGGIKVSISSTGGREVILSIIEPGGVFGEIALLDGMPRTADASAMQPTELFKIHRREFIEFLEANPNLAAHLLKMVCARVRSSNEFVEDYVFLELSERLAKRLLSLCKLQGDLHPDNGPVELRISQVELGQLMGTSREAVNRQLQQWRKLGWIEMSKGRVTVHSLAGLRTFVAAEDGSYPILSLA